MAHDHAPSGGPTLRAEKTRRGDTVAAVPGDFRTLLVVVLLIWHHPRVVTARAASLADLLLNTPEQWPAYTRGKGQYQYVLSPWALRNSITFEGTNERLRVALDRWRRGENLTVSTIGGSITWGHGCRDGPNYPQYVLNYMQDHYGPSVRLVNGALGAIKSSFMSLCHRKRIPRTADIIIVEYNTNDDGYISPPFVNGPRKAYERLIRKLLSYPHKPAVVLLHAYSWGFTEYPNGTFWSTSEGEHDTVAHYYRLPTLSLKTSIYQLFLLQPQPVGFWRNVTREEDFMALKERAFYADSLHPNAWTGMRVLAEIVINFLEQTMKQLELAPVTAKDQAVVDMPLPPPMIPNNHHSMADQCFMGKSFIKVVTRKKGFEWLNDSPNPHYNKWGMVATTVGSVLELTVDTRSMIKVTDATTPEASSVLVQLAYLQTYENIGTAEVTCISGCTCAPVTMPGYTEHRHSQLQMLDVLATQHKRCTLRVTVLNETMTGSHKVKVSACIVSEAPGGTRLLDFAGVQDGQHEATSQIGSLAPQYHQQAH